MSGRLSEAQFIRAGLRKDGLTDVNVELILERPEILDNTDFADRFFYYFDWYWLNNS